MKICKTCNQSKPLSEYYTHSKDCKICVSSQYHASKVLKGYPAYVPKPLPAQRTCRACNQTQLISQFHVSKPSPGRKSPKISTVCKSCTKDRYNANRESILAKAAAKRIPKPPKKTVEETRARQTAYKRAKRQTDSLFKLRSNIGTAIANSLANKSFAKCKSTVEILKCSIQQFKQHLESQFLHGMSWDNRELWHIDHIVPVSFAENQQELLMLNHYINLRPLWIELNLSKGGSITQAAQQHPLYKTIMENRFSG